MEHSTRFVRPGGALTSIKGYARRYLVPSEYAETVDLSAVVVVKSF